MAACRTAKDVPRRHDAAAAVPRFSLVPLASGRALCSVSQLWAIPGRHLCYDGPSEFFWGWGGGGAICGRSAAQLFFFLLKAAQLSLFLRFENQGRHAEDEVQIFLESIENVLFMHSFFWSCWNTDERIRQEQIIHTHATT